MIKSLKKTMSPVLSDISIEWLFPDTKEVLLSPVGSSFLFPGDGLISYAVVCDATRYHSNPKSVSGKLHLAASFTNLLPERQTLDRRQCKLCSGKEEAVQHDALHRVSQLRVLPLPRGGAWEDGGRWPGLQQGRARCSFVRLRPRARRLG